MVARLIFGVCAVMLLICYQASAQMWNFDQGGQGGAWGQTNLGFGFGGIGFGGRLQQEDRSRFRTCIGKNINGDEMRVTFSQGNNNNNLWGNRFNNLGGNSMRPRVSAVISAGQSSSLFGQYQLVATTGSRVEEGCSSISLGEILGDRTPAMVWWGQPRTPRGIVGTPVTISQGQTATSSESMEQITLEELTGRGLALCRADQVSGNTCVGIIPLCCKIGYDSQAATTPFNAQMFPQGMQNSGMMGGMPQGMNQGLGMNPAMNQGFGGGFAPGMNQGGLSQGINQGMAQNLPIGMNNGLAQGSNNPGAQGLSF